MEDLATRAALGAAIDDLSPEMRRRFLRLIDMWSEIPDHGQHAFLEIMRTIVNLLGV